MTVISSTALDTLQAQRDHLSDHVQYLSTTLDTLTTELSKYEESVATTRKRIAKTIADINESRTKVELLTCDITALMALCNGAQLSVDKRTTKEPLAVPSLHNRLFAYLVDNPTWHSVEAVRTAIAGDHTYDAVQRLLCNMYREDGSLERMRDRDGHKYKIKDGWPMRQELRAGM